MDKSEKYALLYKILDYRKVSIRQSLWIFAGLRWMKEEKILKYYRDDCFQEIFKSHFVYLGQLYKATSVDIPHNILYYFGNSRLKFKLPNYHVLTKQIDEYFKRYCFIEIMNNKD